VNLEVPKTVQEDQNAVEIARVWTSNGKQVVALNPDLWRDPACWGLMLVDLAAHIANAYEQMAGMDRKKTLARIREGFDAEWRSPTDTPTGSVG